MNFCKNIIIEIDSFILTISCVSEFFLFFLAKKQVVKRGESSPGFPICETKQIKHEKEINEKIKVLARDLRDKNLDEEICKKLLNANWDIWLEEYANENTSIESDIKSTLREKIPSNGAFNDELIAFDEQYYETISKLENSISFQKISEEYDQYIKIYFIFQMWKKENVAFCQREIFSVTNQIFKTIDEKLSQLHAQDAYFNISYITELFDFVNKYIDDYNNKITNNYRFMFLPSFRAMMLTHVSRYATWFFTRLDREHNIRHNSNAQMTAYKETAFMFMKNILQDNTESHIALGFFRDAIMQKVVEHVSSLISTDAMDYIFNLFPNKKHSLIKQVLTNLAQTENFQNIQDFIEDPRACTEKWLIEQIKHSLFVEQSYDMNFVTMQAQCRIDEIFQQLQTSCTQATLTKTNSISIWIEHFVKHNNNSKGLTLSNTVFVHVIDQTSPDMQNFVEMLERVLVEMKTNAISKFRNISENTLKWTTDPVVHIMDTLWGCAEVCMFCGEPCMSSNLTDLNKRHIHECLQHRPQGINGIKMNNVDKLEANNCCQLVNTEHSYEMVRGKSGKFCKYKDNFPEWIISSNIENSKYWMWIFSKFQEDLIKLHNAKFPNVQEYWKFITRTEAIESIVE